MIDPEQDMMKILTKEKLYQELQYEIGYYNKRRILNSLATSDINLRQQITALIDATDKQINKDISKFVVMTLILINTIELIESRTNKQIFEEKLKAYSEKGN